MKALSIAAVLLFILASSASAAITGINIVSQTHHVWGGAGDQSYDLTDSNPLTGGVVYYYNGHGDGYASSSAGDFSVSAYTGQLFNSVPTSYAESTYLFKPTTTLLSLSAHAVYGIYYSWQTSAGFTLTDVTDSLVVESLSPLFWYLNKYGHPAAQIDWQNDYVVNPLHQYELHMLAHECIGEGGGDTTSLSMIITPEPATLLIFALGGVIMRKKSVKIESAAPAQSVKSVAKRVLSN
jgi:hypothetical protein